jgi:hypothetical protein
MTRGVRLGLRIAVSIAALLTAVFAAGAPIPRIP